jgi:hypothetical protein
MTNYHNKLKEILANKDPLTPERLQSLMGEAMQFLNELRTKMVSKDLQVREEAMSQTLELKELLEAQMSALSQSIGINPFRLSEMDLMGLINEQEQEAFASTREQFGAIKESIQHQKIIKG